MVKMYKSSREIKDADGEKINNLNLLAHEIFEEGNLTTYFIRLMP